MHPPIYRNKPSSRAWHAQRSSQTRLPQTPSPDRQRVMLNTPYLLVGASVVEGRLCLRRQGQILVDTSAKLNCASWYRLRLESFFCRCSYIGSPCGDIGRPALKPQGLRHPNELFQKQTRRMRNRRLYKAMRRELAHLAVHHTSSMTSQRQFVASFILFWEPTHEKNIPISAMGIGPLFLLPACYFFMAALLRLGLSPMDMG